MISKRMPVYLATELFPTLSGKAVLFLQPCSSDADIDAMHAVCFGMFYKQFASKNCKVSQSCNNVSISSKENEKEVRKEIYDQTTKLSLITHVPPPPLDTYVCVEGHPFVTKKKIPKVPSVATLADDILRGIEFPKPRSDDLKDTLKDDNGEILARERLR